MKILFALRPEIFSILIMIYLIVYDRYCARFRSNSNEFFMLAIVDLGHCVMALVTEITVNLTGFPKILNDICHILFFAFALMYSLCYLEYSLKQILPQGRLRKNILLTACILSLAAVLFMVFAPISYLHGQCTDYSVGLGPTLCYALGFIYFIAADVIYIIYAKRINRAILICLLPLSFIALGLLLVQILIPEFLYTAQAMTITALGLFLVIENPVGKFKNAAYVDHNTQVWNRNGYEYDLENHLREKAEKADSFVYLMADINSLKAVNDTLGHLEGDRLIETTARILREQLRSSFKLYRMGGDEFVALYYDQPQETIAKEAEKATALCSRIIMSSRVKSGISIGYAERVGGESIEELSKRAERMMYDVKKAFYADSDIDRRDTSMLEYDTLTGVYTREAFFYHAEQILKKHPDKRYSLIMSNINDFKMVNETYGKEYADKVLIHGAAALLPMLELGIPVGRYSGDKFVTLMEYNPENIDMSFLVAQINKIKESFPVTGLDLKIGIYNDVDRSLPMSVLCDRVWLAVRSINHQYGKNVAFYDQKIQEKEQLDQKLELDMKQAYDEKQFKVFYQPKHDCLTGKLIGAEALIRWEHPQLGFLTPDSFIPLFERNGFISYADFYVWKRTCENLRKWIDAGIDVVPISVNSSRRDYDFPDYLDIIAGPLKEFRIDPKLLHLEVTESIFTDHLEILGACVQKCRDTGLEIELDDFGSGFSSLNILGSIPIDTLKLDRSLVTQIQNPKKARVLSACLTLAHSLGLRTVAEGVETREQLNYLKTLQCDGIQGFYYSKPIPEDQFEAYMQEYAPETPEDYTHTPENRSGMYVIDDDYRVVLVNNVLRELYPQLHDGDLCYKALMGLDHPCDICPVKNHILGPQTYMDPLRNVLESVQVVEIPLEDGRDGHAIVLYTLNQ